MNPDVRAKAVEAAREEAGLSELKVQLFLSALEERGMVVVPREATEDMVRATFPWFQKIFDALPDSVGTVVSGRNAIRSAYQAMVERGQGK